MGLTKGEFESNNQYFSFESSPRGDVSIFHMDEPEVFTAHTKSEVGYNGRGQNFPQS